MRFKPEQFEIDRLRKEVARLKEERDILGCELIKGALVGIVSDWRLGGDAGNRAGSFDIVDQTSLNGIDHDTRSRRPTLSFHRR